MLYHGSCHCGDVKFEAQGDLQGVMACNCSICRRKGALMWFVPRDHMTLLTPDDNLATYLFNKHVIRHRFCKRCGTRSPRGPIRTAPRWPRSTCDASRMSTSMRCPSRTTTAARTERRVVA